MGHENSSGRMITPPSTLQPNPYENTTYKRSQFNLDTKEYESSKEWCLGSCGQGIPNRPITMSQIDSPKLPAPLSQRNIIIKTNFRQRPGQYTSLSGNETQEGKWHRQSLPCKADDLVASGQRRQQAALCLFLSTSHQQPT
jgi:hypothetical protein